jgi:dihydrofolate reductase
MSLGTTDRLPARLLDGGTMTRLKFSIAMSVDGYVAGPNQSVDNPLGEGGMQLHQWVFATRAFRAMTGQEGGETGLDDRYAMGWSENVGAVIMGRNMFGPIRGGWGDESWRGWWGDDPPYHVPVFVLTHHARDPVQMKGGTTFHFVTDGIEAALERARDAAGERDVNIGGGAETLRQYLKAGLVDEFRLHVTPVILGVGERLFADLDGGPSGFECVELVSSPAVAHYTFRRARVSSSST